MKRTQIAALLAATLFACGKDAPPKKPIIRSVRYVIVKGAGGTDGRVFSGTVEAGNKSKLAFQVPGRIQKLNVKVGDRVKKGQVIAALDPTDFQLQLREAQAAAAQARAQSTSAKANYDRVRALYENQNASRQDLDSARAAKDSGQSAAAAAYQSVQRVKRQLGYATLKAPGAGTIVQCSVETNEVVGSAAVIAVLQVGEQLEVAVGVPETAINDIERGDEVSVRVEAKGDSRLTATVYEVGVPTGGGAMFPVSVRFAGQPEGVRAGMAAQVEFKKSERIDDGSRVVPASAVSEDRSGRFVYGLKKESEGFGKVVRQPVEVGALEGAGIRLLKGVKDGDLIITAGVTRITDGLTVRVPAKPGALQ